MADIVLDIDTKGNIKCLYTDEIDLFAIGKVVDMRKASNVEFNEKEQCWEVLSLKGEVLHTDTNRESAIEWEIQEFSWGESIMRKVHYRVILDVFTTEDEDADIINRLSESGFCIDPQQDMIKEFATIEDIAVEGVHITDSR